METNPLDIIESTRFDKYIDNDPEEFLIGEDFASHVLASKLMVLALILREQRKEREKTKFFSPQSGFLALLILFTFSYPAQSSHTPQKISTIESMKSQVGLENVKNPKIREISLTNRKDSESKKKFDTKEKTENFAKTTAEQETNAWSDVGKILTEAAASVADLYWGVLFRKDFIRLFRPSS